MDTAIGRRRGVIARPLAARWNRSPVRRKAACDERIASKPAAFHHAGWSNPQLSGPVRRASITSVLLILSLTASASACVAGGVSPHADSRANRGRLRACAREKPGIASAVRPVCGHIVDPLPGTCAMRSFVQFQFAATRRLESYIPLPRPAGTISFPSEGPIMVPSIGSPETDRGPPRSWKPAWYCALRKTCLCSCACSTVPKPVF